MQQERASLRGSGARYQADRLSIGRSVRAISQESVHRQVIEKVVYKDDARLKKKYKDLKQKLNESLMRLIVVGADNERLNNRLRKLSEKSVFTDNSSYELHSLRTEVGKLTSILQDKDREIVILNAKMAKLSSDNQNKASTQISLAEQNSRL